MRAAALALLCAGCFNPAVPTGGYRCSVVDQQCPSGQHCSCGLCVNHNDEAACSVDVALGSPTAVVEHEKFPVTLTAHAADGSMASGFNGQVALAFLLADGTRWADVRPPTADLKSGSAQLLVTINRETSDPQRPQLVALLDGTRVGAGPGMSVRAARWVRDATAIAVQPAWSNFNASLPSVVPDSTGARMYFLAQDTQSQVVAAGAALSPDGVTFAPQPSRIYPSASSALAARAATRASPFRDANGGWHLAASVTTAGTNTFPAADIYTAHSTDGLSSFIDDGPIALGRTDCPYCDQSVWLPTVINDPSAVGADGGAANAWLMFFGAMHCAVSDTTMCKGFQNMAMSIGRAHSTDGVHFTPEPAPVLSGEQGGEAYLTAPVVLVDGTIYKLWYAYARTLNGFNPCGSVINIGYATSSDGFYWVRSQSNPVLQPGANPGGWDDGAAGLIPSAVLPRDGHDPESGLQLYYSVFRNVIIACLPDRMGRATTN